MMQRGGKLTPQKYTSGKLRSEVGCLLNEKARLFFRRGTLQQAVGTVGICYEMLPLFFATTASFMEFANSEVYHDPLAI